MIPDILYTALTGTLLVMLTVLIHYEALRAVSALLPKLTIRLHQRVLVVMFGVLIAHSAEICLYALGYYLLVEQLQLGAFGGVVSQSTLGYLYFSAVTYTSLGLGDVYPLGDLRLVAGIEALIGLLMIGWSASFTYLTMEKFWNLHRH